MLSRDGVIARLIFTFCLFFLSGTQMVTGWLATTCGLLGFMTLTSALMRYSPLVEFLSIRAERKDGKEIAAARKPNPRHTNRNQ